MTASSHTVIVTGATSGFGRATAQKFAEAGAHVVVAGRREERFAALKDQFGDLIHAVPLDVRDNAARWPLRFPTCRRRSMRQRCW